MSMTFHSSIFSGGTFISSGDNDASAKISKGFEILHGRIAPDAFHNAGDRFDAPKCHPNTRLAVINNIMCWVQDLTQIEDVLWLYGSAGAGKSAIAQTIAEMCAALGLLVASFFFFRTSSSRNNERHLMASIAYQLALSIPETRPFIGLAVHFDPFIFDKSMETQVETLIIVPLETARSTSPPAVAEKWPRLILIDGLDECIGSSIQRSIIHTLSTALLRHRVPLILFVASRPEPQIRSAFNAPDISHSSHHIVLDSSYDPDADIKEFLSSRFKEIRENHPLATFIPESWPSTDIIDRLVQKSSGQFIYASTVIKYIDSRRHSPMKRLDVIIGLIPVNGDAPYKQLDTLYTHIFSCVEDWAGAFQIIGFLIFGQLAEPTPQFLQCLFGLQEGDVYLCLSELHSILDLPPTTANNNPIRIFHASLRDFLVDKQRSRDYYLDDVLVHTSISRHCLSRINKPESSTEYEATAMYSCLHLAYHCSRSSTNSTSLKDQLMQSDIQRWSLQLGSASSSHNYFLDIPLFFEWLEKADKSGRLLSHIRQFWDRSLLVRLKEYTSSNNAVNLAVILIFPRYWAIRWLRLNSTVPIYLDVFENYFPPQPDSSPERQACCQLFIDFFEDRKRSGRYHVNGDDYARVALQCIQSRFHGLHGLHGFTISILSKIDPAVLYSFTVLLSKASPLYSLYSALRDRLAEGRDAAELGSLAHLKSAIGAYIEKYERSHPLAKWQWKFFHFLSELRRKANALLWYCLRCIFRIFSTQKLRYMFRMFSMPRLLH